MISDNLLFLNPFPLRREVLSEAGECQQISTAALRFVLNNPQDETSSNAAAMVVAAIVNKMKAGPEFDSLMEALKKAGD